MTDCSYYRDQLRGIWQLIDLPENEHHGRESKFVSEQVMGTYYRDGIYYAPIVYNPCSRPSQQHAHDGRTAQLAWPTEIPVHMMVNICCEQCKKELEKGLRKLPGVHDVGIKGWATALVTVTGNAGRPINILKGARKIWKNAEFWDDKEHSVDNSSGHSSNFKHH